MLQPLIDCPSLDWLTIHRCMYPYMMRSWEEYRTEISIDFLFKMLWKAQAFTQSLGFQNSKPEPEPCASPMLGPGFEGPGLAFGLRPSPVNCYSPLSSSDERSIGGLLFSVSVCSIVVAARWSTKFMFCYDVIFLCFWVLTICRHCELNFPQGFRSVLPPLLLLLTCVSQSRGTSYS